MTNHLALRLDRERFAEMSCIAGVGGDVPALLRRAHSGRPIIVLDGCPLRCAHACLARHGLSPHLDIELSRLGVKKMYGSDFDPGEAQRIYAAVRDTVLNIAPQKDD